MYSCEQTVQISFSNNTLHLLINHDTALLMALVCLPGSCCWLWVGLWQMHRPCSMPYSITYGAVALLPCSPHILRQVQHKHNLRRVGVDFRCITCSLILVRIARRWGHAYHCESIHCIVVFAGYAAQQGSYQQLSTQPNDGRALLATGQTYMC